MQHMIDQCAQIMGNMMHNGMMMGGGMMGGMMGMMLVGTLLVLALVIAGVMLLVRVFRTRAGAAGHTPLTILQERFARGELDIEEYQQRRNILVSQGEV